MDARSFFLFASLILVSCSAVALACHGTLLASGITEEEKEIIMREHNKLRQMVATGRYPGQPAAENMREMVWDDELAARAQKWADNCQYRHDPKRTINRFTMGQNLALIWSTAPLDPDDGDFPSRIKKWFDEVQKYSFGDEWSPKTGHYSQLVWGETSLIGCGFSEYKDTTKYNKLYVCNYGPGGNVVGYNPYEVGKPSCATYGLRPSTRYPGLCAASKPEPNSINSNTIEYDYQQSSATQSSASSHFRPAASTSTGFSYGTNTRGGSSAHTAESSQYNRYKNKLEAYKPSTAEFQNSVRKHTVLRSSLTQQGHASSTQGQQAKQPQPQGAAGASQSGAIRGWSLLTWRG